MNEDKDLVGRTLGGEKRAFEMIVQKYQSSLFNYIGRMVPERELALDFTQEVFLRAYPSLRSYKPRYKFSTWLFAIASNCLIDYWRKKKLPVLSLDQPVGNDEDDCLLQVADKNPSVVSRLEAAELRARIEQAVKKLPSALRELFVLRHISDLSYEEISEIKRLPIGTVKNRVFQAKERLRFLLEEEPWVA